MTRRLDCRCRLWPALLWLLPVACLAQTDGDPFGSLQWADL